MKLLTNQLSNSEKDAFMVARGMAVCESGLRYWDPETENEYTVVGSTLDQLMNWFINAAYRSGKEGGRIEVQDAVKTVLNIAK